MRSLLRQLRMSVQARALFSRYSSAWKPFSNGWRFTLKKHWIKKWWIRLRKLWPKSSTLLELQQKKPSKAERVSIFCTKRFSLTEPFSEKYLKKLFGNSTDIEGALKRLDRLTEEGARMAAGQLLKVTNTIDNGVGGIADNVLVVDNRMAGVDDHVKDVENAEGMTASSAVDDKLAAVIDGAQYIFNQSSKIVQLLTHLDGNEARGVIQQTADDVDQVKRSLSLNRIHAGQAGSIILTGNLLRQDLRRWLSPPDLFPNHEIACNTHHKGTATWFFEGRTYTEWKSTGSGSLLWIHGKRVPLSHSAARMPSNNILYL
jgi:hypothetical protein